MPHRYVCSVLDEMRDMVKTLRFDRCLGLIEEAQTMVNRMEARLYEMSDKESYEQRCRELKREKKEIYRELEDLREEAAELKEKKAEIEHEIKKMSRSLPKSDPKET